MASITIFQISPQNIQEVTQLQSSITIESLTQSGGIISIGSISQTVPFNASWDNLINKPAYLDYIVDLSSPAQGQIDLKANTSDVASALALKADKTYVDTQDALKADISYVNTQLGLKANSSDMTTSLATKANTTYVDAQDANLQSQITSAVSSISAKANTTYVDAQVSALQTQINTANTNISAKASISYVDSQDSLKENTANKSTTMTGNTTSNIVFLTAKAVYDWAVGLFAPISSPALTGTPTAPTATAGTNTTQIATTAYVMNAVAGGVDLSSYATISYVDSGLSGKASTSHTHADATTTTSGFMSASDKTKLNGIATGATANTGTVTSVALTVPTGLTVTGSPITTSGTFAVSLTAGYSIPTTASQTNWDTAYTDRNKWDGGATGLVAATGRASLGLGTAALSATTDFAAAAHSHSATDITSGTLPTARGGTGTTTSTGTGNNVLSDSPNFTTSISLGGTSIFPNGVDAWTSYSTTMSNVTVGTGGITQMLYTKVGRTVTVRVYVQLGTSGFAVSGTPTFTLPFTPANSSTASRSAYPCLLRVGGASPVNYFGWVSWNGSTVIQVVPMNAAGTYASFGSAVSSTIPGTWSAGDSFGFTYTYEATS